MNPAGLLALDPDIARHLPRPQIDDHGSAARPIRDAQPDGGHSERSAMHGQFLLRSYCSSHGSPKILSHGLTRIYTDKDPETKPKNSLCFNLLFTYSLIRVDPC